MGCPSLPLIRSPSKRKSGALPSAFRPSFVSPSARAVPYRISYLSTSSSRATAPVLITFDDWDRGGIFDWYRSLHRTAIHRIELWKERDDFKHEFVVIHLESGTLYRLDRRPFGGANPDAVTVKGCKAEDSVTLVDRKQRETIASKADVQISVDFNGHKKPDLYTVVAICVSVQMDDQAKNYTLQQYNCYFLARTIVALLVRHHLLQQFASLEGIRWDTVAASTFPRHIFGNNGAVLDRAQRSALITSLEKRLWPIVKADAETLVRKQKHWHQLQSIMKDVIRDTTSRLESLVVDSVKTGANEWVMAAIQATLWHGNLERNLSEPRYRRSYEESVASVLKRTVSKELQKELPRRMVSRLGDILPQRLFSRLPPSLLANLPPELLARLPARVLEKLPQDILVNMPPELLSQLPPELLARIPKSIIEKLPDELLVNLPPALLENMPPELLSRIPVSVMERLPDDFFARLPQSLLERMPPEFIARIPVSVMERLPADLLLRLPHSLLEALPAEVLTRIPISVIERLPDDLLVRLPCSLLERMSPEFMARLPVSVIERVPDDLLVRLPHSLLEKLPPDLLARIPTSVFERLSDDLLIRLPHSLLEKLPPECLKRIPISVLERLPDDLLVRLPRSLLESIPLELLARIPVSVIERLPADLLGQLPNSVLEIIPPELLARIPASVLEKLPSNLLARLPNHVLEKLPNDLLGRLPASLLDSLPPELLARIPIDVLERLPDPLLAALPPYLLEKMPAELLGRIPVSVLERLPDELLVRLPSSLLERLPVGLSTRIPTTLLERLPNDLLVRLPPSFLERLPAEVLARISSAVLERLPEELLASLPPTLLENLPVELLARMLSVLNDLIDDPPIKLPADRASKSPEEFVQLLHDNLAAQLPNVISFALKGDLGGSAQGNLRIVLQGMRVMFKDTPDHPDQGLPEDLPKRLPDQSKEQCNQCESGSSAMPIDSQKSVSPEPPAISTAMAPIFGPAVLEAEAEKSPVERTATDLSTTSIAEAQFSILGLALTVTPRFVLEQLPCMISLFPISWLKTIPPKALGKLPPKCMARFQAQCLERLPQELLANLPPSLLQNLPRVTLERLPTTLLARLPVSILKNIPDSLLENLPEDLSDMICQALASENLISQEMMNEIVKNVVEVVKESLLTSSGDLPESIIRVSVKSRSRAKASGNLKMLKRHEELQNHILDMTRRHSKTVAQVSRFGLGEEAVYNGLRDKTEDVWRTMRSHGTPPKRFGRMLGGS
ncbi:hypothetical protein F5887DRAFT_50129 [Amanita rubescens]|nr:hypothetical protein F5887DRAFT_50129 [Amanita rubescens]